MKHSHELNLLCLVSNVFAFCANFTSPFTVFMATPATPGTNIKRSLLLAN